MTNKNQKHAEATVVHGCHQDGSQHVVGIGNLRVMISEAEGGYVAQGMEIDYFSEGDSVEQAQTSFEQGLAAMIEEHLKLFGGIKKLLVPAPANEWAKLVSEDLHHYTTVELFNMPKFQAVSAKYPCINFYLEAAA